jgi:excinuclease UvrABC nuclease subunit
MRSEHDKTVGELLSFDKRLYEKDPETFVKELRERMGEAVEALDFETAALIRDELYELEGNGPSKKPARRKKKFGS